jgi:thiol-disulfide isomerase/thioredoxin
MSSRVAIATGLLSGIVAAAVLIAAAVAFVPDAGGPTPLPTGLPRTADPSGSSAPRSPGPSGPIASASAPGTAAFHIGEPAPPLVVPQVGGGTIDLAVLDGQPVWLNFMATWCPPCVDELPLMNGFAARYADDGLVVIAVDVREDEGDVAAFTEGLGVTFPVGLDADGRAQDAWDAVALPVHYWIDADGMVRDGALGGIGADVMADGVRAILPGVEVTP